eukprot:scaffold98927_cov20-Prasinocladus_malaysianus.AAC.1
MQMRNAMTGHPCVFYQYNNGAKCICSGQEPSVQLDYANSPGSTRYAQLSCAYSQMLGQVMSLTKQIMHDVPLACLA